MIVVRNLLTHSGLIVIEQQPLDVMCSFRQHEPHDPEAGGILLGFRRSDHLHVVDLTVPHAEDSRSRVSFFRSEKAHQRIAMERWRLSGGKLDYIGEWHTHPEKTPTPSSIDLREWRKIAGRSVPMLFLILGNVGDPWISTGLGGKLARAGSLA